MAAWRWQEGRPAGFLTSTIKLWRGPMRGQSSGPPPVVCQQKQDVGGRGAAEARGAGQRAAARPGAELRLQGADVQSQLPCPDAQSQLPGPGAQSRQLWADAQSRLPWALGGDLICRGTNPARPRRAVRASHLKSVKTLVLENYSAETGAPLRPAAAFTPCPIRLKDGKTLDLSAPLC